MRAKGSKEHNTPTTSLKWGRNTTRTFLSGEDDDSSMEDIPPGGDDGDTARGTGKRTKRSLAGNTTRVTATRQKYTHTAYVVMPMEIGAGMDKANVVGAWEDMTLAVIDKCHGFDASCCYIPPDSQKEGKLVYWKADKPKEFFGWDDYMAWDNRDLMSINTPKDRRRRIVSHCLMGMSSDPTEFIAKHNVDINRVKVGDSRVDIAIKHF